MVQGSLGDCWFLGALSVLATDMALLRRCFWPPDDPQKFADQGLFVCRFYKDGQWAFVLIDDRIPVHRAVGGGEVGKPCFAR